MATPKRKPYDFTLVSPITLGRWNKLIHGYYQAVPEPSTFGRGLQFGREILRLADRVPHHSRGNLGCRPVTTVNPVTLQLVQGYAQTTRLAMSLTPGAKLGSHEILDAIGAGGMGEVRLTGKKWFGGVTVSRFNRCDPAHRAGLRL